MPRRSKTASCLVPLLCEKRLKAWRGFTLIELLVTVAIIGILAATIVPFLRATDADRLTSSAQVLAADLETARNLAVTNQSKYRLVFAPATDSYYLEHSGTNTVLNTLPPSPFAASTDPDTRYTTDLGDGSRNSVWVYGITTGTTFSTTAFNVEFTSLGSTTATSAPTIWLATGQGSDQRYLPLTVNATTGLVDIGDFTGKNPNPNAAGGTGS